MQHRRAVLLRPPQRPFRRPAASQHRPLPNASALNKMARADIIVGLEIGTAKVCAVVAETRHDGTIKILGVGQTPSRGVRKGEIVDFDTAGKCVREALADAEEKSDVMIRSVYLAVNGGHIESFNNRGSINIPEDREEICEEDFEDVQSAAREVTVPSPNRFVHSSREH